MSGPHTLLSHAAISQSEAPRTNNNTRMNTRECNVVVCLQLQLSKMKRFASFSASEVEQKRQCLTPENTKKSDARAAKLFRDYLAEKRKPSDFQNLSKEELDKELSSFYLEARTLDGQVYKKTSLDSIRYGLNRYLKAPPHNKTFDIIHDSAFAASNDMYKVASREIKATGRAEIKHHPHMVDLDREKLYRSSYLSTDTPYGLYNKVQYDVRYFFCRRGCENMEKMTKSSFSVQTDESSGRKYVTMRDELTKNHRDDQEAFGGFMPETRTPDCPVASFEKYRERLHPDQERFWCYPRDSFLESDAVWYTKRPVGVNTLQQFLPRLSKKCGLSRVYTNHSVRATAATMLHTHDYAPAACKSVTGHKSISSLATYQHTSATQKLAMADTLFQQMSGGNQLQTFEPPRSRNSTHMTQPTQRASRIACTVTSGALQIEDGGGRSAEIATMEELEAIFHPSNEPGMPTRAPTFHSCNIQTVNIHIHKS